MKIGRTLPPAAAPIPWSNIGAVFPALLFPEKTEKNALEEELKALFGVKYCFLLSSGKAALTLILRALHALNPQRNEVLIPAFTCYSVPAAIRRAGLKIRLCDPAESSLDLDPRQLLEKLGDHTSSNTLLCCLITHFYGLPADLHTDISKNKPPITIIEDAAQSMGEATPGGKLGTMGDVGFFSLGRGKALSAVEGGVIVTNRDDLGGILGELVAELPGYNRPAMIKLLAKAILTNILQRPSIYWLPRSLPFLKLGETLYEEDFAILKMSPAQRILARRWHDHLQKMRAARRANIRFWQNNLPSGYTNLIPDNFTGSLIRLPLLAAGRRQRDALVATSNRNGLGIMTSYPTTIARIQEISNLFTGQEFPRAEDICSRLFTLPVHELVSEDDNDRIAELLSSMANN